LVANASIMHVGAGVFTVIKPFKKVV